MIYMKQKHATYSQLDGVFSALSNPVRLRIFIEILEEACECDLEEKETVFGNCVTHISDKLELPQSTVSTHIKELVREKLLVKKKQGRRIYFFGNPAVAHTLKKFGQFVIDEVEGHQHD